MLFNFFFLLVLIYLAVLRLLFRQVLYHLTHAPSPFCFGYFEIGSCFYGQASQDHDLSIYASHVVWISGSCHHTQIFIGWHEVSRKEIFIEDFFAP
jgi:hypothetical protein